MIEAIVETINNAPTKSGVYMFKDAEGNVLYVGKAKNLRNRLKNYLSASVPHKIKVMLKKAASVEIITTDTELNAFILENNLIKTHRPPFNVMLKDDKSYPYIKLALKDPYPYIEITRRVERDGSVYYGPYVPAWAVRETLKILTQSFPIRRCKSDLTKTKHTRPCLNHQMGKCLGPCCGKVDREEYMRVVKELMELMEGRGETILKRLEQEMMEAAERLEFEKAARIRDRIFSIKRIMEKQRMLIEDRLDMDVIGCAREGDIICISLIFVRKGMVVGEKPFIFEDATLQEAFDALFREFYTDGERPPMIVCRSPQEEWGRILQVEMRKPWNRQIEMVLSFAEEKAEEKLKDYIGEKKEMVDLLESARDLLKLKRTPLRVEGYDISNTKGEDATGSMVVFELGKPVKSQYRKFRIKQVKGPDDYAMHEEVIRRRIKHSEWKKPDLIVIDGGYGQLRRVLKVLEEEGWDVDAVAISKDHHRDHIWTPEGELDIPKDHPVYLFLQRIRDESHRFALSHHRKIRSRRTLSGVLESIEGIGPVRRARILNFLANTETTPTEDILAKACSIPVNVARKVIKAIKAEGYLEP